MKLALLESFDMVEVYASQLDILLNEYANYNLENSTRLRR